MYRICPICGSVVSPFYDPYCPNCGFVLPPPVIVTESEEKYTSKDDGDYEEEYQSNEYGNYNNNHINSNPVYNDKDYYEQAKRKFQKAIKLERQGIDKEAKKQYQQSKAYYKKAIKLNPNNTTYKTELKKVEKRMNRTTAEKEYNKAVELERQGQYEEAINYYKTATNLYKNNKEYKDKLLKSCKKIAKEKEKQEKYKEAKKYYRILLDLDSNNIEYKNKIIKLQKQEAVECYNKVVEFEKQGKYINASEYCNEATKLDPDNTIYQNKMEELKIKEREYYETTFRYIQDLIRRRTKKITLKSDIKLNKEDETYFDGIIITIDDIIIDGDGHTIDAQENGSIFNISAKKIILKNIHLKNSINSAIHINTNSDVSIINCTFTNNKNNGNLLSTGGGAILNNGKLTITNSIFKKNQAYKAGAILNNNNAQSTITKSTFNNNIAKSFGGAISNHKNAEITITDSQFNNNQAHYQGGAIINRSGTINLINS